MKKTLYNKYRKEVEEAGVGEIDGSPYMGLTENITQFIEKNAMAEAIQWLEFVIEIIQSGDIAFHSSSDAKQEIKMISKLIKSKKTKEISAALVGYAELLDDEDDGEFRHEITAMEDAARNLK